MKRLRPVTEHSLESLKFFPVAAWILVIGFALFVVHMTLELVDATRTMTLQSGQFEAEYNEPLKRATTTPQKR
ncbi:MAG TPA: hypothetical protein VGE31_00465 [Candidatus Paceibacterota bacterium]